MNFSCLYGMFPSMDLTDTHYYMDAIKKEVKEYEVKSIEIYTYIRNIRS